jgi:hypothetical protein
MLLLELNVLDVKWDEDMDMNGETGWCQITIINLQGLILQKPKTCL